MHPIRSLPLVLALCASPLVLGQDLDRATLEALEWGSAESAATTKPLRERAAALTEREAAELRARLAADPGDLSTRLTLIFHEEPEPRRERRARNDPVPHGRLVLGLIEEHPRSVLAGGAGFFFYAYKRDGMYTGPAWEEAIALWERLVAEHPEDAAIACNAGQLLLSDPFRWEQLGERALALLERARALAPDDPRYALKLGACHAQLGARTREDQDPVAAARTAVRHLRAAWDLTPEDERAALAVHGKPLTMVLATALFDAGEPDPAREFARLALAREKRSGDLVYRMNVLLGRIALAAGDVDGAVRHLLAASETTGSPVLGSFGPKMTLARELLAAGRRAEVIEFLERCRRFWHSGGEKLDAWIRAIGEGRDPWEEDR